MNLRITAIQPPTVSPIKSSKMTKRGILSENISTSGIPAKTVIVLLVSKLFGWPCGKQYKSSV
jgi:hypothetical protein